MNKITKLMTRLTPIALSIAALSQSVFAQTAVYNNQLNAEDVEVVIVTGTRFGSRTAVESSTPIDSIARNDIFSGGQTELQDALRINVPSFNIARPVTSGIADFLRSPTLRGLSPGQTLLLINGKRRHTNSDLNVGNQIGRGDVAHNFNAIPALALDRVEVLRDGASAQYGSDAVAGIINIILDETTTGKLLLTGGATTEGDGEKVTTSAGYGWALPNDGFLRVTGEYQQQEFSNRSRDDTRQQYFGTGPEGELLPISSNFGSGTGLTPSNGELDPREGTIDRRTFIFGQPEYEAIKLFTNAAMPLNKDVELFSFGGYSEIDGQNPNFFRRAGQEQTVRSIHPDGFIPFNNPVLTDYSFALGARGDDILGFGWELSTLYGKSETEQSFSNSNNVSFGNESPTDFERGSTELSQWTTNLDLTRHFDIGSGTPLMVALGAEYRREGFKAIAGEPSSYEFGGIPILDGPNLGNTAPAGSQPVPGSSPAEEVSSDRNTVAIYAELEKEWANRFLVSLAGRFEEYSDFGSTTDFRLATRYTVTDTINLRGSVGTSFRAPALPQSFFQRSEISFAGGVPTSTLIASPNDEIAPFIGAEPLTPEEATNVSVGLTYSKDSLSFSIDAYRIDLDDRIVLSSQFSSPALTAVLLENNFDEIRAVTFESNAVDTTTQGIDITARHYSNDFLGGRLTSTLAAGFVDTGYDRISDTPAVLRELGIITPLFDLRSQVRLAEGTPQDKITLNFDYQYGAWRVNLTATRYGEISQADLTNRTQAQVDALIPGFDTELVVRSNGNFDIIETFGAKIVTDLSVNYEFNDDLTLRLGADNIFDVYPDEQVATTVESTLAGTRGSDNTGIFPYSALSPFGVSGTYVYGTVMYSF
ncbi:TonB-dependent receptor plug domain-containing protein [Pseudoalteromonas mariniglutinosa]|uniref:TonB-dependent receptor plug domain-containing protein n=1 Tax=Pseudoalteromonas mariniglutinosa TaxID=206042 RepID=UPI00384C167B